MKRHPLLCAALLGAVPGLIAPKPAAKQKTVSPKPATEAGRRP